MSDLILWTRQEEALAARLRAGETCRVRRAYVERKYGASGANFLTAYGFFAAEMARRIPPQPGEELPYWLHGTAAGTGLFTAAPLLRLRVPRGECLLFDARRWNRVLNLEYLGADAADERRFAAELARQGVPRAEAVFRLPFYPLLRREITASWALLFAGPPPAPAYLGAAVWRLDPAWLAPAAE